MLDQFKKLEQDVLAAVIEQTTLINRLTDTVERLKLLVLDHEKELKFHRMTLLALAHVAIEETKPNEQPKPRSETTKYPRGSDL